MVQEPAAMTGVVGGARVYGVRARGYSVGARGYDRSYGVEQESMV